MLKIYLTDLAAYNQGYLIGEWITLPSDNLDQQLQKVLKAGEAICALELGYYEAHEEYFITDYEWEDVSLFYVDEYENLNDLNERLEALNALNPYQHKAVAFLLDIDRLISLETLLEKLDDVIVYENQSMEDVAYDLVHESYNIKELPELIANHIDYETIARDLEYEGTFYERDGDIFVYTG